MLMISKRTETVLRRLAELGELIDADTAADANYEEFRTLQARISDELAAFVGLLIDAKQLTVCVAIDDLFAGGKLAEYQYIALEPIGAYPNGSVWMDAMWDGTGGFRDGSHLVPNKSEVFDPPGAQDISKLGQELFEMLGDDPQP